MKATTMTRAAGFAAPSAAADIPSGKPSETPKAHSTMPTTTNHGARRG